MGIIFFFDMPVNSFFIVILMGTHEVSHPKNTKEKERKKLRAFFMPCKAHPHRTLRTLNFFNFFFLNIRV
jgi:hypothetical protein